jgi:hypothetical protein
VPGLVVPEDASDEILEALRQACVEVHRYVDEFGSSHSADPTNLDHSCGLWRDGPSFLDRSVESMIAV